MSKSVNIQEKPEKITKEQKEVFTMLSIGALLEYVDVSLYIHMSFILGKVFFPENISNMWFLSNFAVCSTFFFKPIGALIIGRIGDILGRRVTIFITTSSTAMVCLVTACLPGYSKIGITAAYILTFCRVMQGISSTGELQGAKLYMMENIKNIRHQCFFSSILALFSDIGRFLAIAIASFAAYIWQFYPEGWRIAFFLGSLIACVGTYARTCLRESVEFADAKKSWLKTHDNDQANNHPAINVPVSKKSLFYFIVTRIADSWTVTFVPFFYCKELLVTLGLSATSIIHQNHLVSVAIMANVLVYALLVYKIDPMKINIFRHWACLAVIIVMPFWLISMPSTIGILIAQCASVCSSASDFPANPMFYKRFPIFKRVTCVLFGVSIADAIASLMFIGLSVILTKYLHHYCLYILVLPVVIISLFGKYHFKRLYEKEDLGM